ncbi:MAG TPA: chemotaxis protein CheW [Bacillota bacterium]|nr:chemotaxis protein CheW [Bacillota bacterium]
MPYEESTLNLKKFIVFEIADEEFAIPVEKVGAIERLESITRVPQTEKFVKGVINLRGVVIPVIDLRTRFGLETKSYDESTRIIIIHLDETEVGLIVDQANDVIDISEDSIEPAPEVVDEIDIDYISGVIKIDKRLLIMIDLHRVLSIENPSEYTNTEG